MHFKSHVFQLLVRKERREVSETQSQVESESLKDKLFI